MTIVRTRRAAVELERTRHGFVIVRNMQGEKLGHIELLDNGMWRNSINPVRTYTKQAAAICNLQRLAK